MRNHFKLVLYSGKETLIDFPISCYTITQPTRPISTFKQHPSAIHVVFLPISPSRSKKKDWKSLNWLIVLFFSFFPLYAYSSILLKNFVTDYWNYISILHMRIYYIILLENSPRYARTVHQERNSEDSQPKLVVGAG